MCGQLAGALVRCASPAREPSPHLLDARLGGPLRRLPRPQARLRLGARARASSGSGLRRATTVALLDRVSFVELDATQRPATGAEST